MFHRSITNSSFARMAPITAGYRRSLCLLHISDARVFRKISHSLPGSKSHPACHSSKSKRRSTEHHGEVQISMGKKCWQIQLNGKNKPNHRSEPAEPLDSPHESPISKRKICSRRRPSTRTFVWIFANMRHFFAPRPRAFTKIAMFVLQNVPIFLYPYKRANYSIRPGVEPIRPTPSHGILSSTLP